MKQKQIIFSQDFYAQHLSTINNIHFTAREIDVIACLLNGRKTSKIAFFLLIDPRTVETHVRNIMSKLGCNSRERIIDFIEASDKVSLLRKYYSLLRINVLFEKNLKDISKITRGKKLYCSLKIGKDKTLLSRHLKSHLTLAGLIVSSAARNKEGDYVLCVLPKTLAGEEDSLLLQKVVQGQNKTLVLLQEGRNYKEVPQELVKFDSIDFAKEDNYYFSFFIILKKLLEHPDLDKLTAEFKDKYKAIHPESGMARITSSERKSENQFNYKINSKVALTLLLGIGIFGGGFSALHWIQGNKNLSFRSDLVVPKSSACLYRPELIQKIDEHFKKQNGIQTIALMGPGGAGKTTLARQYASRQKRSSIWEINAETRENLNTSFEKLARELAKTEIDEKILRAIQEIKNPKEREEQIIQFIKDRLKKVSNWILLFDNVETFTDIQKHFPYDSETWGQGRIILTTRDSNIGNNKYVNTSISIEELEPLQKLDLFMSIMTSGDLPFTKAQEEEATKFLSEIPPFPLDVSIAAYYIKLTNIPYKSYLKQLRQNNRDFGVIQETFLKGSGDYARTRYSIVISSLQKIINEHKDFGVMLILISMLDSQNIPRDLLSKFNKESIVDSFIYSLKKYSLIVTSSSEPSYSIHRSTQAIALSYLEKLFALNEKSLILKEIVYALDDYVDKSIEQEDFSRMRLLAPHLEKFLTHQDLLPDFSKGLLGSKLGSVYYFVNSDKSREILNNSLKILRAKSIEQLSSEDTLKLARSLLHIGAIYTELRLYKEAEELFKKSKHIYEQEDIKNYADLSWTLSHIGNVERRLGNYEKAKDYLEKSIHLHKQYGVDRKRMARILAYLGSVYRGLGLYQKSVNTLEESLAIYNEDYPNDHFRIGWTLTRLGNVYSDLGDFKRAKQYFEKGLLISKKYFPEDHVSMGLTLTYLGACYRELGEYDKSAASLEQSLKVHQKHFDPHYRRMGWVLFHLATTYKALGKNQEAQGMYKKVLEIYANYCSEDNIEVAGILRNMARIHLDWNRFDEAEDLIQKSLRILQSRQHIDAYRSLEVLGEIYLNMSSQTINIKNSHDEVQLLRIQAANFFNQALKIIEPYFTKDSTHIQRIKTKIKNIQK